MLRRADRRREALVSGNAGGVGCGVEWRREGKGELPIGDRVPCVPKSNLIFVRFPSQQLYPLLTSLLLLALLGEPCDLSPPFRKVTCSCGSIAVDTSDEPESGERASRWNVAWSALRRR